MISLPVSGIQSMISWLQGGSILAKECGRAKILNSSWWPGSRAGKEHQRGSGQGPSTVLRVTALCPPKPIRKCVLLSPWVAPKPVSLTQWNLSTTLSILCWITITKCHRLSGLKSWGWQVQCRVLPDLVASENLLAGSQMAIFSFYPHMAKGTQKLGVSFFCKALFVKMEPSPLFLKVPLPNSAYKFVGDTFSSQYQVQG